MVNRTYLIGAGIVLVVLAVGIGAAVYYGVGPAPGGSDSGQELTDFPTATPGTGGTAGDGTDGSTATSAPPFTFVIDNIEECGQTCRDVTATLRNNQDDPASGVTVFTRVFAGEDNTAEDDLVWEGKEEVGTIDAGGSHTTTRRVELSLLEANKIQQKGGWITIVTTVRTDDRTITFRDTEQVA
ncbi:MAG: hypothetical protein ABEH59_04215 [Halobacteriales archaeon]